MIPLIPVLAMMQQTQPPKANPWESQIFYQIFPRSYRDSNGDGIGDFKGIEDGLPSIKKLGCTAILINPIQKSRLYHNYFADDFTDVDPDFGTLREFDHMVKAAHRLDMKVVIDMEPQYVANKHPWYIAAEKDPHSPEAKFLIPGGPYRRGFPNWYKHDAVGIAKVNLNNPAVVEALKGVFRFWSDHGVDGYRIDHMMDNLDYEATNKNLYATLWTPIENEIKSRYPGSFFVGEQADWDAGRSPIEMFEGTPTDACFNFRLKNAIMTFKKSIVAGMLDEYQATAKAGRVELNFVENHDMNRFASVETDPKRQRLAAALIAFAKGSPIIYYGQELGMKGERGNWGSDGNDVPIRLAYRWNRKLETPPTPLWYKNGGPWWNYHFSKDNDGISLEEEDTDPNSLLNWYRKILDLRLATPALLTGSQTVIDEESETILAFRRTLDSQSELVLANMSEKVATLAAAKVSGGKDLLTGDSVKAKSALSLKPWQVMVIEEDSKPQP